MDGPTVQLFSALMAHCRLPTTPVGVKLARADETAPAKAKSPTTHIGHRLAVCQGMTIARTLGWAMAFGADDHACPLPKIFMGHIPADKFMQGTVAQYYQDDPACRRKMEASYPRWPLKEYAAVWLAPLNRLEFIPDLVVAYGNPAQILALIQAANFGHGPGITSQSTGRYGCSAWLAGVHQSGSCTYMVPGPGERVFAGTQDHEMSFAMPRARFTTIVQGLEYIRKQGSFRYPVPNLGVLAEPSIPDKYHEIEPD